MTSDKTPLDALSTHPVYARVYQRIADNPSDPRLHFELGTQALERDDWELAATCFGEVTRLAEGVEAGFFNLGNALFEMKRFTEAAAAYQTAFELQPSGGTMNNLGNCWAAAGDFDQAIACYRRGLEFSNQSEERLRLFGNLGRALESQGRWDAAAELYADGYRRFPSAKESVLNYVRSCLWQRQPEKGIDALNAASEEINSQVESLLLAADCHEQQHAYGAALVSLIRASAVKADDPQILARLGEHYRLRGRHLEAMMCVHRALTLEQPGPRLHSQWLSGLVFQPQMTPQRILEETRRWATIHLGSGAIAAPKKNRPRKHRSSADQLPLRLGFILTDQLESQVVPSLVPLLKHLDAERMVAIGYCDQIHTDGPAAALALATKSWHSTNHLNHEQLSRLIQADRIDVLFDLTGHARHNRLPVFASRSAPLQMSWGCWSGSSGLQTMDAIVCDQVMLPTDSKSDYIESPCYLPVSSLCYAPPDDILPGDVVPTNAASGRDADSPSFSSLNLGCLCPPNLLAGDWLNVLARIMIEHPDARLLLADATLGDRSMQEELHGRLAAVQIAPDRVEFFSADSAEERLRVLGLISVVLDPFPVGAVASCCEALWMGVPVVSMLGRHMCGRATASLLTALELTDWIADTPDAYVSAVGKLIRSNDERQSRRFWLHERFRASAACDVAAFASSFQQAIEQVWNSAIGLES